LKPFIRPSAGRPRRHAVAASAVIGAHVALVLIAWQMKLVSPRGNEPPRSVSIRLIPDKPKRREDASAAAPRSDRSDRANQAAVPPAPAIPAISAIVVPPLPLPTETDNAPPATATASGSASTAPGSSRVGLDGAAAGPGYAASGPPGLALTPGRAVMQGSLANPAVNDPRSNSPRPTFEEKIAMGLDPTLCLKWERLPDGTTRRALIHRKEAQSTMSATHGGRTKPVMVCE